MLLSQNRTLTTIPDPMGPPSVTISDCPSEPINKWNLVSFHELREQVFGRLMYISNLVLVSTVFTMPMIDVYAPADLFPAGSDGRLGKELTLAVLRAEGVATPGPFHLNNTAAFIHRMDPHAVHTAATDSARTVRVQVITPPAALTREGQKQLVKEITEIVTKISGDPSQASRTWVILTEAAEGGWGLSGTAFGREEVAALAAKAAAARAK